MCLAQGPQRSDAGEAQTRGPSVSSQALYHWATAVPQGYDWVTLLIEGQPSDPVLILFVLMLYIQVNNFSVMLGHFPVFLGYTNTKQRIKYLAQGHNTVPPVSLEPATLLSEV